MEGLVTEKHSNEQINLFLLAKSVDNLNVPVIYIGIRICINHINIQLIH